MPFNPTPPTSKKPPLSPAEKSRQVAWGSALSGSSAAARNQKSREVALGKGVGRLPPYYGWQKMMLRRGDYAARYGGPNGAPMRLHVRAPQQSSARREGGSGNVDGSVFSPPPPRYEGTLASPPPPYPGLQMGDDLPPPSAAVVEREEPRKRTSSRQDGTQSRGPDGEADAGPDRSSSNWRKSLGRALPRRKSSEGDGVIR